MAKPMRGLGRGLDALLADTRMEDTGDALLRLAVTMLQPGRYQPRSRMDQDALTELAASIKTQGLMQPILVRPVVNGNYEIIAGERRWRAAQLAGLAEVPVVVRSVPDEAALAMALIENIQREDLNALEEAQGIQRLIDEFGMTHESAATALGRSRSAVSNLLRLLQLPEPVRDMLHRGEIDMGHGRALLSLTVIQQLDVARKIVDRSLSVRETEKLVQDMLNPQPTPAPRQSDPDVQRLEQEVAERIGAKVQIRAGKKGNGSITIDYGSLEQLDALLERLR